MTGKEGNLVSRLLDRVDMVAPDKPSRIAAIKAVERTTMIENGMLHGGENFRKEDIPETFETLSEIGYFSLNGEPSIVETSEDGNLVSTTFNNAIGGRRINVSVEMMKHGALELIFSNPDENKDKSKIIPIDDPNFLIERMAREIALLRIEDKKQRDTRQNLG
jgi:Cft2 family RNA processing exonuclease